MSILESDFMVGPICMFISWGLARVWEILQEKELSRVLFYQVSEVRNL